MRANPRSGIITFSRFRASFKGFHVDKAATDPEGVIHIIQTEAWEARVCLICYN